MLRFLSGKNCIVLVATHDLEISPIRFYERKGLVQPERRADSKYREYGMEDIAILKSIILYRKLDFSIEEIGQLEKK
ncbi:MAG: MerR family transcriptional regulator [Lachnospiraceae bacterium]|nr:MerR family transcriptional regulator [Lachnospiraceae bacterium]